MPTFGKHIWRFKKEKDCVNRPCIAEDVMRKSIFVTLCVSLLMLIRIELAVCYDDQQTHPALTDKAILQSNLDIYLKQNFGNQFPDGFDTSINGNRVRNIVKDGSKLEDASPDVWKCRRSTHFHNPLAPSWGSAGLSDIGETFCLEYEVDGGPTRYSALTWATGAPSYQEIISKWAGITQKITCIQL